MSSYFERTHGTWRGGVNWTPEVSHCPRVKSVHFCYSCFWNEICASGFHTFPQQLKSPYLYFVGLKSMSKRYNLNKIKTIKYHHLKGKKSHGNMWPYYLRSPMTNSVRLVYIWLFYRMYCSSWMQCANRWYNMYVTAGFYFIALSHIPRHFIDRLNICCLISYWDYFHRLYTKTSKVSSWSTR